MVTVNDIARKAGVSQATVSNVLNNKGNVSVEKIKLVMQAAKELNYQVNKKASLLRSGTTNSIAVIIPRLDSNFSDFYIAIKREVEKNGFSTVLFESDDDPKKEEEILDKINQEGCTAVIAVSCLDDTNVYVEKLKRIKNHILFINTSFPNENFQLSLDTSLIKDVVENMLSKEGLAWKDLCIITSKIDQKRYFSGMDEGRFFFVDYNHLTEDVFELMKEDTKVILVGNEEAYTEIKRWLNILHKEMKIIYLSNTISDESSFNPLYINFYGLGLQASMYMMDRLRKRENKNQTRLYKNIGYIQSPIKSYPYQKLKILSVPSPAISAIDKIKSNFQMKSGVEIDIIYKNYEEIAEIIESNQINEYDLVRVDVSLFPWVAKRKFLKLNGLDESLDHMIDTFDDHLKNFYMEIEQDIYSIPFDPSSQMMFYRKDIFDDSVVQKLYYDEYKETLKVPETIEDLLKISEFFHKNDHLNYPISHSHSMVYSKPNLIIVEFLLVYYALGGIIGINKNRIQFDDELLLQTIDYYHQLVSYALKENANWWDAPIESYNSGKTALIIGFANHLSQITNGKYGKVTAYANVPGNKPLLGGGVFGIVNTSEHIGEAVEFLKWVSNFDINERIVHLGGLCANPFVFDEMNIHNKYPWLQTLHHAAKQGIRQNKTESNIEVNSRYLEQIIGEEIRDNFINLSDKQFIKRRIKDRIEKEKESLFKSV